MLAAPSALAERPPGAVTGAATEVGATSAVLDGVVTPHGHETTYFFEYGASRHDSHTAHSSAGDGREPVSVRVRIDGLRPETTYKARIVAFTEHRITTGDTVVFTTQPAPPPAAALAAPAAPAADSPVTQVLSGSAAPPPPVLGERVSLTVRTGRVAVKVPGARVYAPLSRSASVPVGSLVDTRNGSVTLHSALPGASIQSGTFHGGLFQVRQRKDSGGLTELVIRGRRARCRRAGASAAARRRRRPRRALWGSVRGGRFRTRGANSVATVRGTVWYVEDRCDGTLTRVRRGSVVVRDLRRKRTVIVRARRSYLARATR